MRRLGFALVLLFSGAGFADNRVFGLTVSEAVQVRIPRVDNGINTFSNVLSGGAILEAPSVQFMPNFRFIYSYTNASQTVASQTTSESAKGVGFDLGVRIAYGAGSGEHGWYLFGWPAFSSWDLSATFPDGEKRGYSIQEFSTEAGFGYRVEVLRNKAAFDVCFSVVHLGFRPLEKDIVTLTTYPSVAIGFEWLLL